MSRVELPSCPNCRLQYADDVVPLVLRCGHTVCQECVKKLTQNCNGQQLAACPVCQKSDAVTNLPKNYELKDAIDMIKKLKEGPEQPKDSLKCSGCKHVECESNLFICRDCVKKSVTSLTSSDLESFVICGNCLIRVHISAGHETLPYFSIAAKIQFESHLTGVSLQRKDLENTVAAADGNYKKYQKTVHRTYKEIDKMTEMMRRSKSSEIQREFARRISEECERIATYVFSVTSGIAEGHDDYQAGFDKLVATNLHDEVEKCQLSTEIPERRSEFVCNSCRSKQSKEKMLCCRKCSRVIDALMSGKIESSRIDTIDTNTLPICMPCVLTNHSHGDSSVVKFVDVLDKYRSTDEVAKMNKKVEKMIKKFDELRKMFQQNMTILQFYEKRLTELSRFAATAKASGHPEQESIFAIIDLCLKDTELVTNSIQTHAEIDRRLVKDCNTTFACASKYSAQLN